MTILLGYGSSAIRDTTLGPEHPDIIETNRARQSAAGKWGTYEEAETRLRNVIELRCRVLGADHEALLFAQVGLGKLYQMQANPDQALSFLTEALNTAKEALGDDHSVTQGIQEELNLLQQREPNVEGS